MGFFFASAQIDAVAEKLMFVRMARLEIKETQ
jgi:hypothetical protein